MPADVVSRLQDDVRNAAKAHDRVRLSVLRLLQDALHQEEIRQRRRALSEEDILRVFEREARQRREAAVAFEAGGRADRAQAERAEAEVIAAFLPSQLSDDELEAVARRTLEGATDVSQSRQGALIGSVMAAVGGRADGARVRDLVARILLERSSS